MTASLAARLDPTDAADPTLDHAWSVLEAVPDPEIPVVFYAKFVVSIVRRRKVRPSDNSFHHRIISLSQ